MKRKWYIMGIVLSLTMVLSSCGNKQNDVISVDSEIFYKVAKSFIEKTNEFQAAGLSDNRELEYDRKTRYLIDDWNNTATYNWGFSFNGEHYVMPVSVKDFLKENYVVDSYYDIDVDVEPGLTFYFEAEVNGVNFDIGVINKTTEDAKVIDCNLLSLRIYHHPEEEGVLPNFAGPDCLELGSAYVPTNINGERLIIQDDVEDGNGSIRMIETLDGTENSFVLGTLNYVYEDGSLNQIFIEYYGS